MNSSATCKVLSIIRHLILCINAFVVNNGSGNLLSIQNVTITPILSA